MVSADFACRAGRYRREHSRSAAVCVSQRRAHRALDGQHRRSGAQHADRGPHHPGNEHDARVEPLQRCRDAAHAAADLGRDRHARRTAPGYPASHGCVRLPEDFAAKLYDVTRVSTTVIIADNNSGPATTTSPGLVFGGTTAGTASAGAIVWQPDKAPNGPVSIIVSAADGAGYIYRNGVEIGRAPIRGLRGISGSHAFSALATVDSSGRRDWLSIASVGRRRPNLKDLANRISVDPTFLANTRKLITPGTSLIVTDAPVNARTRSSSGFNILTSS